MADISKDYPDLNHEESADIDMAGEPVVQIATIGEEAETDENGLPFQEENMEDIPVRTTYIDYLKSPVIGLLVGQGDEQALLTAHQALLVQSPWFADACAKFSDEVSVGSLFN